MPTARPRHTITETDEVARALDEAAERWPEESRGRLLIRLVEEGRAAISDARERAIEERRRAIRETAGKFSYPPGYLKALRDEWPD
ncbi:MAG: hypothetical protein M3370_06665 [Actinomycetota bacterium]|nr:hypothetical protein [Actinomycetota bacterium]